MTTDIMDEVEVSKIPTPNQIPAAIDLSQLPSHVLRSGAVEALANQNEDLVARLSVTLRRTALLENEIAELESRQGTLLHQLSIAQDQSLILQEKDRRVMERIHAQDMIASEANNQLQLLELQYTELYATSREKIRQLARLTKYRRKVRKAALTLKRQLRHTTIVCRKEEDTGRDLKLRLGEAATRITQLSKDAEANQRQLVENYERALKTGRDRVSELERQNSAFVDKTKDFEVLFDKNVALENKVVFSERQFSEYKQVREQDFSQVQTENFELRNANKTQLLENETLKRDLSDEKVITERQNDKIKKLIDQVETLQLLWQDGQSQQERLVSKNQALQKLNQQLSTTVNQHRHEIQGLKHQVELHAYATTERIKEIKGHLQMIEGVGFIETTSEGHTSPAMISKIDGLIAEIQSGFKRQIPAETEGSTSSSSEESRGNFGTSNP